MLFIGGWFERGFMFLVAKGAAGTCQCLPSCKAKVFGIVDQRCHDVLSPGLPRSAVETWGERRHRATGGTKLAPG